MKNYGVISRIGLSAIFVMCVGPVSAQQVYRCAAAGGVSEYINNAKDAQTRGCKPLTGGNVTVIQGTAVSRAPAKMASNSSSPAPAPAPAPASTSPRLDGGAEQRARDSDSRAILESELKKAEARLLEQQKEYNNGEPEKQGIEGRNYQRYLDRVAELKNSITRNQSDIAGIKREIARLPGGN